MAGSKVLQFVLLILFVIFSRNALTVLLSDGKGFRGFNYETEIDVRVDENEMRHYCGRHFNNTYMPRDETTKVIVYIKSYEQMKRTALRRKCGAKRVEISEKLSEHHYELLYLAVFDFYPGDERLIAEFLLHSINLVYFQIKTIGEKTLDLQYKTAVHVLDKYEEEPNVFRGDLLGKLRSLNV